MDDEDDLSDVDWFSFGVSNTVSRGAAVGGATFAGVEVAVGPPTCTGTLTVASPSKGYSVTGS